MKSPTPTTIAALAFAIVSGITAFTSIQTTEKALKDNATLLEELETEKESNDSAYELRSEYTEALLSSLDDMRKANVELWKENHTLKNSTPTPPTSDDERGWIQPDGPLKGARVNSKTLLDSGYMVKPEGVPYCPGPWSPEDPTGALNPYPETK